jgi:hypothetical protein
VLAALNGICDLDEQTRRQRSVEDERYLAAYPFHPDLADVLFEKWTQIEGFQRTRGVLRTFAMALRDASGWGDASLLDDPDPTATVLKALGTALRAALKDAADHYAATLAGETAKLDAHPVWSALPEAQRASLLQAAGVVARALPATGTDAELLAVLQAQDLATAIKEAEPKATRVSLPSATLRNQAELEDWLAQVRDQIEAALAEGPVIL